MLARSMVGMALAMALAGTGDAAEIDLAAAFGARPGLEDVSLSPDGSKIAYIVPTTGQGSALLTLAPGKDSKPSIAAVASGDPERFDECHWIANDRLICDIWGLVGQKVLSTALYGISTFSRVLAIDANGGNQRMLSKAVNAYSRGYNFYGGDVIDWLPDEDGMVLMMRNQLADDRVGSRIGSSKAGITVEKINSRTLSASKLESAREDVAAYISDRRGTLRIMGIEQYDGDKNTGVQRYFYRLVGSREWQQLSDYDYANNTGFRPLAVDYERNAIYGLKPKDGRDAVYRIALDGSKTEELIFARDDVDVDGLITIGRRHRVIGASYVTDRRKAFYFDRDLEKLRASLAKALPKQPQVRIVEASADEKKLLIFAASDDDPGLYYILDRTTREMAIFQPVRPQLEGVKLAKMQPVSYPAADGTMIPAYLTLPPDSIGKNIPAIVMPHGGPSARDEWGFDWLAQYFAARGFAVLQPNFRGSSGYGDLGGGENGFRNWRRSIGDVTDAGRWLIAQGIANPAKLGIVGWSYGGYAALQSAVIDPSLFKAVVAVAPVTDLPELSEARKYWSDYRLRRDFIGAGPEAIAGSPARNAARIKVPVLLAHGTLDRNVSISQSRLMDGKLSEAGVPHQFIVFDKLDHQLEDSDARARLLRESDAFLRKSMGM